MAAADRGGGDLGALIRAMVAEVGKRHSDGGLTTDEWAEQTGWSAPRVQKVLKAGKKVGLVTVGRRMQEALDGKMRTFTVYAVAQKRK